VLEALGNIGDFLGGIGVVVTLIYLAGQIRQNTRSIETSSFQAAQRDIAGLLDTLSHDPELTRIFLDGNRDFESFSKEDRRRYAIFAASFLRRYETLLHQTTSIPPCGRVYSPNSIACSRSVEPERGGRGASMRSIASFGISLRQRSLGPPTHKTPPPSIATITPRLLILRSEQASWFDLRSVFIGRLRRAVRRLPRTSRARGFAARIEPWADRRTTNGQLTSKNRA